DKAYLQGHQTLQALVASLTKDNAEKREEKITNMRTEIKLLKREINKRIEPERTSIKLLQQDHLIPVISPIFERLLIANKASLVFDVLSDW
ncbi:hypothetical protein R0J89_17400, partial [Psychrobacter sp. SIMBA_152]